MGKWDEGERIEEVRRAVTSIPIVLSLAGVAEDEEGAATVLAWFLSSPTMVDVEGEREKVLVRGPRWVSLSFLVNFHDMAPRVACRFDSDVADVSVGVSGGRRPARETGRELAGWVRG
jgi:hypothetical protein